MGGVSSSVRRVVAPGTLHCYIAVPLYCHRRPASEDVAERLAEAMTELREAAKVSLLGWGSREE